MDNCFGCVIKFILFLVFWAIGIIGAAIFGTIILFIMGGIFLAWVFYTIILRVRGKTPYS